MSRPSKRDQVVAALSGAEGRTMYDISQRAGCSVRTAQRHLRGLIDAGVVSTATSWVGHRYGYTRIYWLRSGGRRVRGPRCNWDRIVEAGGW